MKQTVDKAPEENDVASKKSKKLFRKNRMLIIFRELCFLFIITFTAYATILNAQPKTKKGAPSMPFFENSLVDDFYQGDLSQLMYEVTSATYSFVFFYAPWDADSQDLKYEFLETAEFYSKQVYFAGVNCWEPGSECRSRFKDVVERYPQLVAYVGLERAVEYRGPHKADDMIKFLHSIIHPIVKLDKLSDLWRLRYIHDAVLVGSLIVDGPYDNGLKAIYETALSLASRDHLRRIAVAVFTHPKYNDLLGFNDTPALQVYIWTKKIVYSGPFKRGNILKWVLDSVEGQLVSTDSLLFLKPPTVVMFTPIHPLSLLQPHYMMLRRVAMSFSPNTLQNSSVVIKEEEDYFYHIMKQHYDIQESIYKELVEIEGEKREFCSKKMSKTITCAIPPKWDNQTCKVYSSPRTFPYRVTDDVETLTRSWREEECKLLERTPEMPPLVNSPVQGFPVNMSFGFACLDTNRFSHLAEALGLDLSSKQTALVIIGAEEMMEIDEVSEESLWNGLKDWSRGQRERAIHGWEDKPLPSPEKGRVYLPDLGLHSFNSLFQQKNHHAVILYHSEYCGACARAAHSLLELVPFLSNLGCLHFGRINGDKVDLPWHFSLHFFPSLLFLPAIRKSESRLFPEDTPWGFKTLSRFIVSNLNVEERPEVMLSLCSRWGLHPEESSEGTQCIREVRIISIEGIETKLKEARRHRDRNTLLAQLGFLRAVHLILARVTDITKSLADIRILSTEYRLGCTVN